MLNSNIRCIEIKVYTLLKVCAAKLNSNIRCIEILLFHLPSVLAQLLNSNIRCIEMSTRKQVAAAQLVE